MIVPKTKDGRVVFMLPWLGTTIAGTTDAPAHVTMTPQAREADVEFVLGAIADFLSVEVPPSPLLPLCLSLHWTLPPVASRHRSGTGAVGGRPPNVSVFWVAHILKICSTYEECWTRCVPGHRGVLTVVVL